MMCYFESDAVIGCSWSKLESDADTHYCERMNVVDFSLLVSHLVGCGRVEKKIYRQYMFRYSLSLIFAVFSVSIQLQQCGSCNWPLWRQKYRIVFKEELWRGWVTLSTNFRRNGRHPPTTVGVGKLERLPFCVVSKYPQCIALFGFVTKYECDRQTDGQNYNSPDRMLA